MHTAGEATQIGQDEVRRAAQASVDPRALRTREAIVSAVHALIADGVSAPSVSQIVRAAGVSRSSFYTQFANMDELAGVIFRAAFADIEVPDPSADHPGGFTRVEATRAGVAHLVEHVASHRGFYRVGMPATAAAYNETVEAMASRLQETLPILSSLPAGVSIRTAARYLAGGTLAIFQAWIVEDLIGSAEQITNEIMALLPGWLLAPDPQRHHGVPMTYRQPLDALDESE